ncbi:Hpt domain-containing protein [Novipirellula maiorica]|nr:Hpt domain-containing protein [Rhodopirellula maiorica]
MTTTEPSMPIIDREQLIQRMMGSAEMAKRMLCRFVETSQNECDLIESTVRIGDKSSLASLAHRHKGTAQTMASARVAQVAAELETRAHCDETSELLAMVDELRSLHCEVREFLSDEFSVSVPSDRGEQK